MRFGISNLILSSLTDQSKRKVLACAEICDFSPTAVYGMWEQVPSVLAERPYGVDGPLIGALQSLFYGLPDASLVKDKPAFLKLTRHFERLAVLASVSNVPALVFGSPGTRSGRLAEATDEVLTARVRTLADMAEANRVKLCFEVNSSKFGCEYLCRNADLRTMLDELHHPGLGLHLDIGQMIEEGIDVNSYIDDVADELFHLHLSAPDFTCRVELLPLYQEIIRHLKSRGSHADIILEVQKLGGASESDLIIMCEMLAEVVQ